MLEEFGGDLQAVWLQACERHEGGGRNQDDRMVLDMVLVGCKVVGMLVSVGI